MFGKIFQFRLMEICFLFLTFILFYSGWSLVLGSNPDVLILVHTVSRHHRCSVMVWWFCVCTELSLLNRNFIGIQR